MEHKGDGGTNCSLTCCHEIFGTGTEGLGNKRTSVDHPNYSMVEIGQNTKKSPRELRRLAVTESLVENHRLTLV